MSTPYKLLLFLLVCSLFVNPAQARSQAAIYINEIAWMGTTNSPFDEWLELYNNSPVAVDLTGWQLLAQDNSPVIHLSGVIESKEYFLLERTDETSLPHIKADLVYTGGLNNHGEILMLFNANGSLIDQVGCSSGWFSGLNEEKKTMERKNYDSLPSLEKDWQTSQQTGGTPKKENSPGREESPNLSLGQGDGEENGDIVQKDTGPDQKDSLNPNSQKRPNPYIPLFLGLIIALTSALVALYFDKKGTVD